MKIGNFAPHMAQDRQSGRAEVRLAAGGALDGAQKGDVIQAKVLSSSEGSMSLQLKDGSVITASRSGGIQSAEGESVSLTVLGRQNGQIVARMDSAAPQAQGDPAAILSALGLEQNGSNTAIVSEFIRYGLTPAKETVEAFAAILKAFEGASPREISFLLEQDISVTTENTEMLKSFSEGRHQLGDKLSALAAELSAPEDGARGAQSAETAEASAAKSFGGAESKEAVKTPAEKTGVIPSEKEAPDGSRLRDTSSSAAQGANERPDAPSAAAKETAPNHSEAPRGDAPAASGTADMEESVPHINNDGAPPGAESEPGALRAASREPEALSGPAARNYPSESARAGDETAAPGRHNADPGPGRLLDAVKAISARLEGKNPALLAKELDAGALKQRLEDVLTAVRERAASLPEAQGKTLLERARDIERGARFISELNGNSAFVQLPITLGGGIATADLYVFGEKKKKDRIDPENATVFVSLDTVSLGRVEAFVKVVGGTVECDFSLDSKEAAAFFQYGGRELQELLESAGYRLTRARFSQRGRPADLIDVPRRREAFERRYILDVRI